MKNHLKRVFCAAICVLLLTGCGRGGEVPSELVVSSQPESAPDGEHERSAFPAQVCGVELQTASKRVVSLSPAVTEIICELGFKDRLCGVSSYCDYPEGLTAAALGSTENPDTDGIRALSPDVVFTLSALSERDSYELTSVGIAVIPLTAPRTLAEYAALYSDIARAFYGAELSADEKQGEKCAQLGNSAAAALEKAAEGISLGGFVYVTEKLTLAGADTFESAVLSLCGGNLCTESGYTAAAELSPDYIIADEALKEQGFSADEALSAMAQNAQVIYVSTQPFERPSARLCEVFAQIREALAPAEE